VALSADGTKQVAVSYLNKNFQLGSIFTSTNSGDSWTMTSAPSNHWMSVASSADGSQLVAAVESGSIYTSTNSGVTWISNNATNLNWYSVASSADGTKLIACGYAYGSNNDYFGIVYTSTNSGNTWRRNNLPVNVDEYRAVASSAHGLKLVAVPHLGKICTSTNAGETWQQGDNTSSNRWYSVASSVDGSRVVAAPDLGSIYTSSDSGATWTSNTLNQTTHPWSWVASSADGNKLAAVAGGAPAIIYISTDSGTTWTSNTNTDQCISITSSADGNKLVTSPGGGIQGATGWIYILQTTPSPQLQLTPSYTNLSLAWVVPSTNFVLQQSSDLTSWSDATNTPTLNLTNLQNEVFLSPTSSSGFYRLKTP
jgi:photosystem II stability/assembly factor-like uncharacterized protein